MYDEYGNLIEDENAVETPTTPVVPPKLMQRYQDSASAADKNVESAQGTQNMLGYANVGVGILRDFANSQKSDVVLKNRMGDLGRKPNIIEADRPKYDRSILDNMGKEGVADAEKARARVDSSFQNQAKMEDYGRKTEAEARRMDPNSEESIGAREYFKQLVPSLSQYPELDKMSASQVEKIAPGLYKKYANDQADKTKRYITDQAHAAQVLRTNEAKAQKEKLPTGDQLKAGGYGKRMEQAENVFKSLAAEGYNRADYTSAAAAKVLPEGISSEQWKKQDQAERNFINSVLRRESGAVISPEEFSNAEKQYFPRSGDPASVLTQKAQNRKLVYENFKKEAGPGWDARSASEMGSLGGSTSFPMKVSKGGKSTTVENQQELDEAVKEGWQ
jgi:hypothetical protein